MSETRSRLEPVRPVDVIRVSREASFHEKDHAAVEEPLEIRLHGLPFVVTMRTPGHDRELAAGFLLSEGIVRDAADIGAVEHCRHPDRPEVHNVVDVFLLGEAADRLPAILHERRNVVTNSSCGMCGRLTIASLKLHAMPLTVGAMIGRDVVVSLPRTLRRHQAGFDQTGGLHAAALVDTDGACEAVAEDVGRHNAVDKVVGRMLINERLPLAGRVLVVSGRTSFEIVQKGWLAGIEAICAVGAPSSLAIDLAREAGITLVGFAREHGFNVYSHAERIHDL